MRKILLQIFLVLPTILFSQRGVSVDIKIENPRGEMLVVIWKLDWDNKIIFDRPREIGVNDSLISVPIRMGDWAVEYRIDGEIYSIMNLHIYGGLEYYRYMIYYGYSSGEFREKIIDDIDPKVVYGDF